MSMANAPYANEVRAFGYTVNNEHGEPVAHLFVREIKASDTRTGLIEAVPDYAFTMVGTDGRQIADIAPGMMAFAFKAIFAAAEYHSPACDEDSREPIGSLEIVKGLQS